MSTRGRKQARGLDTLCHQLETRSQISFSYSSNGCLGDIHSNIYLDNPVFCQNIVVLAESFGGELKRVSGRCFESGKELRKFIVWRQKAGGHLSHCAAFQAKRVR